MATALTSSSARVAETLPPSGITLDLAAVYREHCSYMWNSLRRLGVRERDLEDLAHDVFVVVHRRLSDFDTTRPIKPWLFGIALRVASDYRRSARYKREVLGSNSPDSPQADIGGHRPDDELALRRRRKLILRALEQLKDDYRAVFVMHELNGHSMPEIASVIDAPLNTLYSRLRLARRDFTAAVRRINGEAA